MTTELYRFQNRRDTAANWSAQNPLLKAGELGFETTTNFFKIGDGVAHWNDLPYQNQTGPTGPQGVKGVSPVFTFQGSLSIYNGATRLYFEESHTITGIRASIGSISVGGPVNVSFYISGTLLGSVSIPAGQHTANLTVSRTVNAGDYATISITSVGPGQPGSDLVATLNVL